MAVTIPTIEPELIYAGETVQWLKSLADFPATDYTLNYYLTGPASVTLTAAPYNTTDHLITVTAKISADYVYGIYSWVAYAEKGSGDTLEKYRIDSGFLTVKTSAGKSFAKTMLDKIEAYLSGQAIDDMASFNLGGKAVSRMRRDEVLKWRNAYQAEYQAELANEARISGKATGNRILMRFKRPG